MGIYASPSGLLMVKRDPTLALYPIAIDDFAAGQLLNAQTNVNATTAGGSTLLAAAKRRNDYQRLTSTFPSLGYRASGAVTNLLYDIDPNTPSFENPADMNGWTQNIATRSNSGDWAWGGSRSMKVVTTASTASGIYLIPASSLAVTAADTQYTFAAMIYNGDSTNIQVRAWSQGNDSGVTYGTTKTIAPGDVGLVSVTKTFNINDTTTRVFGIYNAAATAWIWYVDAAILVAGATVPMFEESECVATSCTFPTPFAAGEPVSFLIFVWTPWAGNDGVAHYLLDTVGTGALQNRVLLDKDAGNNLRFCVYDNASALKRCYTALTAVNWPAGSFHRIAVSRSAAGVMSAYLDGTAFTILNNGAGTGLESAVGATTNIGTSWPGLGPLPLNGIILPYIYRGVAWGDEECQRMSQLGAPPPRTRRVA